MDFYKLSSSNIEEIELIKKEYWRLYKFNNELLECVKDGLGLAYDSGLDDSDGIVKRMKKVIAKAKKYK